MDFFTNNMAMSALIAMITAQILKVVLILVSEKRLDMNRMKETGGMPSSHSATVAALTTSCGISQGLGSPLFAVCTTFSLIIIYDATGIRQAAGKHAAILNDLIGELSHLIEEGKTEKALKTLLGHTFFQVAVGTILGVLIGIVYSV